MSGASDLRSAGPLARPFGRFGRSAAESRPPLRVGRGLGHLALGLGLTACRLHVAPTPAPSAAPSDERLAGIARIELDPPLGGVLAGHGPNGLTAVGQRGRLECDVVYLSSGGEAYAWAACDLAHASASLQRAVAARIRARASEPRCAALGSDRLALSAIHTHGAPGHHYTEGNFTAPVPFRVDGFTPRDPGFDPAWTAHLADRIADGVLAACADARPASLRWDHGDAPDVRQNRSLFAHCANAAPMGGAATTCGGAPDARAEVPPGVDVLELVRGGRTDAAMVFFAVHPTTVPNGNDLYHADLVEPLRRRLRAALGPDAVVAFVNGAEGDVSPVGAAPPGFALADEVGAAIGDRAAGMLGSGPLEEDWTLSRATVDLPLTGGQPVHGALTDWTPGPCTARPARPPADGVPRLCPTGALGTAAGAGAEDGPTIYRYGAFRFAEGDRSDADACHAPKATLADLPGTLGIAGALAPVACAFPEVASVTLLQLGSRRILALPAEPTTTAGLRLAAAAGTPEAPALLASLTNGYLQYVATPEEYAHQQYEAGSTVYGPQTLPWLLDRTAQLAAALPGGLALQRPWDEDPRPLPRRLRTDAAGTPSNASYRAATDSGQRGLAPVHAGRPVPGCAPLAVTLIGAGPAVWADPGAVTVTLTRDGVPLDARHEVTTRALADRAALLGLLRGGYATRDAEVSWEPATCPVAGATVRLEARIGAVTAARCGWFTGASWEVCP